jgi:hypothetical protein
MLSRLRHFQPRGQGSTGLTEAAALIAGRRKLVFLISDFYMPAADMEKVFGALAHHDIIPIVLHDSSEIARLPRWGLMSLTDLEFGRRRLVVMRPGLRAAWQRRSERRRADLLSVSARYGREPFEIHDRIDWDRLSAYLVGGGA